MLGGPSITPATLDEATGDVLCASPRMFNGGGAYQLRLSLHGQQFSFEPYQTLGFWALEPIASLSTATIEPAAGPILGGATSASSSTT